MTQNPFEVSPTAVAREAVDVISATSAILTRIRLALVHFRFAVGSGVSASGAVALVAKVAKTADAVVLTWRRLAGVYANVAVDSSVLLGTCACVEVDFIRASTVIVTRVGQAFV